MNNLFAVATTFVFTAALLCGCSRKDGDHGGGGAQQYTIGGSVSGLTASGLVLQINGANNIAVASSATTFTSSNSLATGATYSVTVFTQPATQTCTVTNGSGTVASASISNVAVNCVTNTYTVAATVTGLSGAGLVLQLNGGNNLSVAASSTGAQFFAGTLNAGTSYVVTVLTQPIGPMQQCTVSNGGGTITANVSNVVVACVNVTTLAGVAAVGAPLAGLISVKDANGTIGTSPIGTNGSYSIDVNGMIAPFVLRAEGTANGHTYIVHSAAVAADIGGTINVTQLTDLMVDNIAGQVASAYFDNGNFASLTPAALSAEAALLKARLLPVLLALGVDASVDLLRSRFTPVSSALDHALDVLRVSVNTTTNIATITNIVTQQQIQDTITVPAVAESNPPIMSDTGGVGTAVADADAVKAALTRYAARFATGLPSTPTLMTDMTADFLAYDMDSATFIARFLNTPILIGSSFTDVNVKSFDYSDPPRVTAGVDFTIKDRNGVEYSRVENFRVRKDTDGVWRLHGNQRVLITEGSVTLYKSLVTGCISSGIEFHIIDINPANNGAVINHVNVYGPGLPGGFIRYNPPATSGDFWEATTSETFIYSCATGQQYVSDATLAAIPDDSAYFFLAFTSANDSVRYNFPSGAIALPGSPINGTYWKNFQRRPFTLTEAIASTAFATITSPVSAAALNAYNSGPLLISASNINPNFYIDLTLSRDSVGGNSTDVDQWVEPTSTGTMSTTLSLPTLSPGEVITRRGVNVRTSDVYRRTIMAEIHTQ
jgi:hypothetical protein